MIRLSFFWTVFISQITGVQRCKNSTLSTVKISAQFFEILFGLLFKMTHCHIVSRHRQTLKVCRLCISSYYEILISNTNKNLATHTSVQVARTEQFHQSNKEAFRFDAALAMMMHMLQIQITGCNHESNQH